MPTARRIRKTKRVNHVQRSIPRFHAGGLQGPKAPMAPKDLKAPKGLKVKEDLQVPKDHKARRAKEGPEETTEWKEPRENKGSKGL